MPCLRGRGDRQHADAVPARAARAGGREGRRHRDVETVVAVRLQLQARILEREPVGVHGDGLAAEQPHDRVEALLHARPLLVRRDPEHVCVRRELARAAAEHHPASGEVIEQHHAVGEDQGVVVGQRADPGAELDVLGPLRGDGDEDLGRRDDLEPGGVVLADPGLLEPEAVHRDNQVEVALDRERRVLPDRVEGCHEVSEAHSPF